MASNNNFAQQVNDFLVTQNYHPEMLNAQGLPDENIENTKIFSFDYVSKTGTDYGTMVIVLGDENEMIVMYGDNLGRAMENPEDRGDFFKFQEMLTMLARRNHWNFTLQDLSKLKYVQAGIAAIKEGLFEGYYGTRKVSYVGEATAARLVINHNRKLGENDARYRYVESIFIETTDGERFKLPHNHLAGGKAMLEHVKQGGKPYDIRGTHINEMVVEMKVLGRFNRASNGRVTEGVTKELVEGAQKYYQQLRENLKHLTNSRGYNKYFESWNPLQISETEGLVEDIKTLFVEQTLDARIEAALPLLAKIQQGTTMKEVDIFESWINNITEGTWSLPDTPESHAKLMELMSQPLIVGPDAINATEQLYDVIGDDVLFDRLSELAEETNGRANIWEDTEIMQRLTELGIDPAGIEQDPSDYQDGEQVQPEDTTDQEAATQAAPLNQAPVAESEEEIDESLNSILKYAGLPIKENRVLDESGETLQHILDRFKFEVKQFEESGELSTDLYDTLYDYYASSGSMPYGIAKARTGDPYEWISDKLAQEIGVNEVANMTTPGAAPLDEYMGMAAVGEGTCNMTEAGHYCPEHGLEECGTSAGGMAPVMDDNGGQHAFVNPHHDDPINSNSAITGNYYESREGDAVLARIKSLALIK